jgi:hypothetical protein
MTDSDGKSLTFIPPAQKSVAEHDANQRTIQNQLLDEITLRAQIRSSGLPVLPEPPEPELEIWPGKDWELAAKVEKDMTLTLGRDPAPIELTEGFKQVCLQYQKKNRRRFTVKNLRDGLKQHRVLPRKKSRISPR